MMLTNLCAKTIKPVNNKETGGVRLKAWGGNVDDDIVE